MQDPQIPQSIWYLTDADFVGFRVVRPLRTPTAEEAKRYDPDEEQLQEIKDYKRRTPASSKESGKNCGRYVGMPCSPACGRYLVAQSP